MLLYKTSAVRGLQNGVRCHSQVSEIEHRSAKGQGISWSYALGVRHDSARSRLRNPLKRFKPFLTQPISLNDHLKGFKKSPSSPALQRICFLIEVRSIFFQNLDRAPGIRERGRLVSVCLLLVVSLQERFLRILSVNPSLTSSRYKLGWSGGYVERQ